MFTFCDVFHEKKKKRKQSLNSVQYFGLGIIFTTNKAIYNGTCRQEIWEWAPLM